jgi:fibronectin type III domain protein
MKRFFSSLAMLSMIAVLAVGFNGCTEDDGPTSPTDQGVENPTQLKAYSDDQAIGLSWTPSASELQSNFAGYTIKVWSQGATDTMTYTTDKGNGAIITGLTNGVRYEIFVYGRSIPGNLSPSWSKIIWSPAVRHTMDTDGNVIKVYATTSNTFPSAIDIHNDQGKAEVISQKGTEFATRGDLFVFAENAQSQSLEIRDPHSANNQGLPTQFSNVPIVEIDNLNDFVQSAPPSESTYIVDKVIVPSAAATIGRMYYGRLKRGPNENEYMYFRMLIKLGDDGSLVQGSDDDRFLELEFSYQSVPNVQYAKRVN